MRERTTKMIVTVVTIVALMMGIPGAFFASMLTWNNAKQTLETRAQTVVRAVDRRMDADEEWVSQGTVAAWAKPVEAGGAEAYTTVILPGRYKITVGTPKSQPRMVTTARGRSGTTVIMEVSAYPTIREIFAVGGMFILGAIVSIAVGWSVAYRMSRRFAAPLIYLAAEAEQIGSGQVRAQLRPSGIEEIDLVQEELVRTGERMAGRLAAERQRAADASHQLRTPLTALSMRLEEIEMITDDEEVQVEVRACLDQVERMTTVISELLEESRRSQSSTEAIQILEVFNSQREEWEDQFEQAGRKLVFVDEAERPVLGETGKIAQVLAVLIENSLRYGEGETKVKARKAASSRGVLIEVSDEGPGIPGDLIDRIFETGVSGHGSSGIGLALAEDLSRSMGGRLRLKESRPPVFQLSLAALPSGFDPDLVMPAGPLISVGRRSRRF